MKITVDSARGLQQALRERGVAESRLEQVAERIAELNQLSSATGIVAETTLIFPDSLVMAEDTPELVPGPSAREDLEAKQEPSSGRPMGALGRHALERSSSEGVQSTAEAVHSDDRTARTVDLEDPALAEETRSRLHAGGQHTLVSAAERLFVDGAAFDDVQQGDLGDCFFVSTAAALARQGEIEALVQENPNGTVTFRFHRVELDEGYRRPTGEVDEVTVDRDLHAVDGDLVYGRDYRRDAGADGPADDRADGSAEDHAGGEAAGRESWFPLLEKAYASWKGGYGEVAEGGDPRTIMAELLGRPAICVEIEKLAASLGDKFPRFLSMIADGTPVVAGSRDSAIPGFQTVNDGIMTGHAYAVLGVEQRGEEVLVKLLEPNRELEPDDDGQKDGIFLLPLDKFFEQFRSLHFVKD